MELPAKRKRLKRSLELSFSTWVFAAIAGAMTLVAACPKNISETRKPEPLAPASLDAREDSSAKESSTEDDIEGYETFLMEDFSTVPLGQIPDTWSGGDHDMVKSVAGRKRLEPKSRGYHVFYIPVPDLPEDFVLVLRFAYLQGGVTLQLGDLTLKRRRFYDELSLQDQKGPLKTGVLAKPFKWTIEKQGDVVTTKINDEKIASVQLSGFVPATEIVLDFGQENYSLAKIQLVGRGEIASGAVIDFTAPEDPSQDDVPDSGEMVFHPE